MHAGPALGQDGFGQEGQDDAVVKGNLARHLAEENNVIDMFNGRVEGQGKLVLRGVIFVGDQVQRQADFLRLVPDRIGKAARVGKVAGAIHHTAGGVIRHDRAIVVADKGIGFQFDADLWGQAQCAPSGNGAFQRAAGAHGDGATVTAVKIARHDHCVRLPSGADLIGFPAERHIGNAFKTQGAGRFDQQILVVMHCEGGPRETAFVVFHLGGRQVFAPHNRQMIAEHRAQARALAGHGTLPGRGLVPPIAVSHAPAAL